MQRHLRLHRGARRSLREGFGASSGVSLRDLTECLTTLGMKEVQGVEAELLAEGSPAATQETVS